MEYMEPYEKYKLEWMIAHGITLKELYGLVEEWAQENEGGAEDYQPFECYLEEVGFGGSLWVCYNEWLEYEAQEV